MEDWVPSDKNFDLDSLHIALWYHEVLFGGLTKIAIEPSVEGDHEEATWSLHGYKKVPKKSLVIKVDPEHDEQPSANTELVTRGKSLIESVVTKVSLFRKI